MNNISTRSVPEEVGEFAEALKSHWLADKPGSVKRRVGTSPVAALMVIYLGPQLLAVSSDLPESDSDPSRIAACLRELPLCLTLLRAGFTKLTESPRPLVSSYLTISPLPRVSRS